METAAAPPRPSQQHTQVISAARLVVQAKNRRSSDQDLALAIALRILERAIDELVDEREASRPRRRATDHAAT